MRVRFLGSGKRPVGEGVGHAFLTVGREYVVLAINARDKESVEFLILDDRSNQPGWHPASDFDLVSDKVPSNWRVRVGAAGIAGQLEVGPGPWLEPGFFNDYWGDGDDAAIEAQETFRRELDVIVHESE